MTHAQHNQADELHVTCVEDASGETGDSEVLVVVSNAASNAASCVSSFNSSEADPAFVAGEIAAALGHVTVHQATARHVKIDMSEVSGKEGGTMAELLSRQGTVGLERLLQNGKLSEPSTDDSQPDDGLASKEAGNTPPTLYILDDGAGDSFYVVTRGEVATNLGMHYADQADSTHVIPLMKALVKALSGETLSVVEGQLDCRDPDNGSDSEYLTEQMAGSHQRLLSFIARGRVAEDHDHEDEE